MNNTKPVYDEYIFTFGSGQGFPNGYHTIVAKSSSEARNKMFERFGSKWSMQYNAPDAYTKAGVVEYDLQRIL